MSTRVPALGPRGEGWVLGQVILFGVIAVAGLTNLSVNGSIDGWGGVTAVVGLGCMAMGGIVAIRGLWDLRAAISPFPRPIDGAALIDTGAYRLVRHPIYSGIVLGAVGWGLVTASIVVIVAAALLFLLFIGKSTREEAWLADVHPGYRDYQRRTRRLIPWVY
jgi:protein-S-isoprenylcysteine O-methyltransferase Ste14